jgi:hypothetical protein
MVVRIEASMDKARKKQLKKAVRQQERKATYAALPLPVFQLRELFQMLDVQLPRQPCDHTRRLTKAWLEERGHDVAQVFAWLDTVGGFCDCEVLFNAEQKLDEAVNGEE